MTRNATELLSSAFTTSSGLSTDLNPQALLGSQPLSPAIDPQLSTFRSSHAGTPPEPLNGAGGQRTFRIQRGDGTITIDNFGGIGARNQQTAAVLAELDTLKFEGAGFTAENLLLTQQGNTLVIAFEGVTDTQVMLTNFQLEDLDNYPASAGLGSHPGNILFEDDRTIADRFDVFDADWQRCQILQDADLNRVTFLNDLSNKIRGFDRSNDVINGQAGDDFIDGLRGNDVLRGGTGNDTLQGGLGDDRLVGGFGDDVLTGGKGSDTFVLAPNQGVDVIRDFNIEQRDRLGLAGGLRFDQIAITQGAGAYANDALVSTTGGDLLAVLTDVQANLLTNSAFLTLSSIGLTTSQGVQASRADIATERYRVDGTGITIGVLSDSFNSLGGAAQDVASGDLPTNIQVLQDWNSGVTDEGRAMMQLIHDVAPGANLLFHTASGGQANFAQGIRDLAAAGADIIVDDAMYLDEPMFQDGIIAAAVDQVVAQGVAYFASAGNRGRDSYESAFRSSGVLFEGSEAHDFDPGAGVDIFQSITIPQGDSLTLSFQWDAPVERSLNDLDIYLLDQTQTHTLAKSDGSAPIKTLTFENTGTDGSDQFNLVIAAPAGSPPNLMKYVARSSTEGFQINDYPTNSSTVYGHANASTAVAVGAASYASTPAYGVNPAELEPFSSVGGTPILFDATGDRLATPERRRAPRIVAPDEVNTTFFGSDSSEDADRFPNFAGTSAAAPQAGAVAALLLQAQPNLSPAELYAALESTALDMDDPQTPGFDRGVDDASGYGLIQADLAIAAVVQQSTSAGSFA